MLPLASCLKRSSNMAATETYKQMYSRGVESALPEVVTDGTIKFAYDTERMFVDISTEGLTKRVEVTDFVRGLTSTEIQSQFAPLQKIYQASDNNHLYYFTNKWIDLSDVLVSRATYAGTATYAESANEAVSAQTAGSAQTAKSATNASTATYAVTARDAVNASTAEYSQVALKDSNEEEIATYYAPLDSPVMTGTPQVPKPAATSNDTQIPTTSFVMDAINAALSKIVGIDIVYCESGQLPATGEKGKIYFVPITDPQSQDDTCAEYVWIETLNKFEKFGSTKVNMDGYYNNYEVTGTGNAISGVTAANGKLSFTKSSTFLTGHPKITTSADTTASLDIKAGDSFSAITVVTRDTNGHAKTLKTTTYKLSDTVPYATNAKTLNTDDCDMDFGELGVSSGKSNIDLKAHTT